MKRAFPPMIVRFPEESRMARFDRWVSLRLMSIPWGPLDQLVFVCGHLFNSPWNSLCTTPLVMLALEASHPWDVLAWAAVALTLVPMALVLKERIGLDWCWSGNHLFLGFPGILFLLRAVDGCVFQVSCLYTASWLYTLLLVWILKCLAGRRRPALIMKEEIAKLPRDPMWSCIISFHSEGDNGYHSFPSGDAAAAGCFASAVLVGFDEVHWAALALMALAMYGRIYVFAHHLLDVLAGAAIGVSCTLAFAACANPDGYHVLLTWNVACVVLLVVIFIVGPVRAALLAAVVFTVLGCSMGRCLAMLAFHAALTLACYGLFVKTSFDQKAWVLDHLEEFFGCAAMQEDALPELLRGPLLKKRAELRRQAADRGTAFPSNVYSIYAYTPGAGTRPKPFAADWEDLSRLMALRLEDFSRQTGLELRRVDVVLGVYTGGAFLAQLVASRLGCDICHIRISRYSDDVLGHMGALRTMRQKFSGRHEELYTVSDAPDASLLEGKVVLMVDDAVGTGGTFRTAYKFCMQAGARDAKGVALDCISPGGHVWDPNLPRPVAQTLEVPCFVPWGLR
uniref:Phosphatidic acid phosphatase type 2/haloperoxidase domain-containing protein n=1 Tax=Alexandrium catenella TaxID=2925 RepID=A0A7S1MCS6_ALECA